MPNLPSEFRYEKRTCINYGDMTQRWCVEGASMAIEFWMRRFSLSGVSAGVEEHNANPPSDLHAPSHARCWCLSDRACWPNGSSLLGGEWATWFQQVGATDEDVFLRLASELRQRIEEARRG